MRCAVCGREKDWFFSLFRTPHTADLKPRLYLPRTGISTIDFCMDCAVARSFSPSRHSPQDDNLFRSNPEPAHPANAINATSSTIIFFIFNLLKKIGFRF